MTKIYEYLDLIERISPIVRAMFGNKEVSECVNDVQALLPILKGLGLIK